jgi:hypothetical protein
MGDKARRRPNAKIRSGNLLKNKTGSPAPVFCILMLDIVSQLFSTLLEAL